MKGYRLEGQVLAVLLGMEKASLISTRCDRVTVSFEGLEGDMHAKRGTPIRNIRQVSIVSQEDLDEIAAKLELPEVLPEWLGANLLISGIPRLSLLPPGTRLIFPQGTVLRVEEENQPCINPGKVIAAQYGNEKLASRFVKAALQRRGVVATVELPGTIEAGDAVTANTPVQVIYSPGL
jgi:MOSC domain-containing protein YiiM